MKKIMLLAVAVGALTFTSCSSDDDNGASCAELMQNYNDAFEAYFDEESDENCAALDAAAEAFQNSDCQGASTVTGCSDE